MIWFSISFGKWVLISSKSKSNLKNKLWIWFFEKYLESRLLKFKSFLDEKFLNNEILKFPANGNWLTLHLGAYDLKQINQLRIGGWITKELTRWEFELRLGSDTGTVLATGELTAKGLDAYNRAVLKLQAQDGTRDIYLAVRSAEKSTSELQLFDIAFDK
ncbi:MAG: carbohydrate-binding protein [Pedobacter sp.]|nr:MAG: carbohydrate-binding protein [Pedobacter sp.]